MRMLCKGHYYNELNDCYIVFICLDDPFDEDLCKYTFRNRCDEDFNLINEAIQHVESLLLEEAIKFFCEKFYLVILLRSMTTDGAIRIFLKASGTKQHDVFGKKC